MALGCLPSASSELREVRALTNGTELPAIDEDVDARSARAPSAEPLDADAAVRTAVLHNRELRARLREMGIARGQVQQAGLWPNPVIEVELLPERNTEVELRAEYDLTQAIFAPLHRRALRPNLEAGRYEAAMAVVELGYRVRGAFYQLQAAKERLHVGQQVLEGFAARRDAMRAMHEAGNVSDLDSAIEEVAYEQAAVRVEELELAAHTETERFRRVLGIAPNAQISIDGELPEPTDLPDGTRDHGDAFVRQNFQLSAMRQRLVALRRQVRVTRAHGSTPDIAVDVHWLKDNSSDDASTRSDNRNLGAGVSATVPLFDRDQGTANSLSAEHDALLERLLGAESDLVSAVRETQQRVISAYGRATRYRDMLLPAQRRVTEQTVLHYNAMQLGVFHLIEARRAQLDVELGYIDTLREYWTAVAELKALKAGVRVTAADGVSAAGDRAMEQARGGGH